MMPPSNSMDNTSESSRSVSDAILSSSSESNRRRKARSTPSNSSTQNAINKQTTTTTLPSSRGSLLSSQGCLCQTIKSANPITTGILIYLAMFQFTYYHYYHHGNINNGALPQEELQQSPNTLRNEFYPISRRATEAVEEEEISTILFDKNNRETTTTSTTTRRRRSSFGFPNNNHRVPLRTMLPPPSIPPEPVEWAVYSDTVLTELTYPVFMTSMPKSGTTSMTRFFECGNQKSSHNWVLKPGARKSTLSGLCIQENIQQGKPPFENCGEFDIYTDTGYLNYQHDTGLECFYPSIDGLEAIYHSYPNATFVNAIRDSKKWYESLKNWSHSSLFVRFRLCNATGFPNGQSTKEDFYNFYAWHNELIRQFVKDRPSINYIEVTLEEDETTAQILQDRTGIDASCWKKCKPESKLCEQDKAKMPPTQNSKQIDK